ncbi:hypothetical protein J1614_003970 [Plenodomus biglobosus]|nr:hypothetical protein J1614_003970 [Plenodomus biglobosus]
MDQRHLPDPSQFGLQGRCGGTLESVMLASLPPRVQPNHVFQLAPIREPHFEPHTVPASIAMSRRPSEASFTSSNYSDYNLSRSTSPTSSLYLEPGYDSSSPVNRIAMHTAHFSPSQASTRPASKAVRRKRNDRKHFSRLRNEVNGALPKFTKEQGEAGRRYDHSVHLALLQRAGLDICPDLPQVAAQGKDQKPGWTPLKSNNRSEDVKETKDENGATLLPLAYNKNNIFASTYQIIMDSNDLIASNSAWHRTLEAEARSLTQRDPTKEELMAWACKVRDSGIASQITMASGRRGAVGFRPPFSQRHRSVL